MGTILRGICAKCGYQADALTGGGLRDCDSETALSVASGDQGLAAALDARGQFRIERFPAICTRCRELISAAQVTYWAPGGGEHVVQAVCPRCGGPVGRGDTLPCPVCASPLELSPIGNWD